MRVAIVGFGTAGTARLGAYRQVAGAEVVAVVDPSSARLAGARDLQPQLRTYLTLSELFAMDRIDVVDVCTPPSSHVELAIQALDAGSHVICEKPVAFRTADARALAGAATRAERLLYPAHNYAFSPMMRMLTEGKGKVGTPVTATIRIRRATHARGVGSWQPDWRRDPAVAGGGILLDHGSHCVYMVTRLFGARPGKVSATARWQEDGLEEAIEVRLHFPDGTAEIDLSWVDDARTNHYGLSGSTGTLDITDGVAVFGGSGGSERRTLDSPTRSSTHEEWFADMFDDFAEIVSRPGRWDGPMDEILSTAQIIEAAYESARLDGRLVELGEG
jgi:predicted dehydrogenase